MDHQIFYLTKYSQQIHLILRSLSLGQMNHSHKVEVINLVSQEGNLSFIILDTSLRRSVLSFMKLGQWSKKCHAV